jgi:hypothetical protein
LPQDLNLDIDGLTVGQALKSANFLASVVDKAHGRQMDDTTQKSWADSLEKHRSKSLDAPSWLWSIVVSLIVRMRWPISNIAASMPTKFDRPYNFARIGKLISVCNPSKLWAVFGAHLGLNVLAQPKMPAPCGDDLGVGRVIA